MKDFDEGRVAALNTPEADRTFVIGGETFTCRASVRPEVMFEIAEMDADTPSPQVFAIIDRLVLNMIEPVNDAQNRWRALREREDDPLTINDLNGLVSWLVEQQAGRPTEAPSLSLPGRETNGTPSTASSSSDPAAASVG